MGFVGLDSIDLKPRKGEIKLSPKNEFELVEGTKIPPNGQFGNFPHFYRLKVLGPRDPKTNEQRVVLAKYKTGAGVVGAELFEVSKTERTGRDGFKLPDVPKAYKWQEINRQPGGIVPFFTEGGASGGQPQPDFVTYRLEICLLYTSPSPRDRQKSRMPSSA